MYSCVKLYGFQKPLKLCSNNNSNTLKVDVEAQAKQMIINNGWAAQLYVLQRSVIKHDDCLKNMDIQKNIILNDTTSKPAAKPLFLWSSA